MSLERVEGKIDKALIELGEIRSTTLHIHAEQGRIRDHTSVLETRLNTVDKRVSAMSNMLRGAALVFAFIGATISTFFDHIWNSVKGIFA